MRVLSCTLSQENWSRPGEKSTRSWSSVALHPVGATGAGAAWRAGAGMGQLDRLAPAAQPRLAPAGDTEDGDGLVLKRGSATAGAGRSSKLAATSHVPPPPARSSPKPSTRSASLPSWEPRASPTRPLIRTSGEFRVSNFCCGRSRHRDSRHRRALARLPPGRFLRGRSRLSAPGAAVREGPVLVAAADRAGGRPPGLPPFRSRARLRRPRGRGIASCDPRCPPRARRRCGPRRLFAAWFGRFRFWLSSQVSSSGTWEYCRLALPGLAAPRLSCWRRGSRARAALPDSAAGGAVARARDHGGRPGSARPRLGAPDPREGLRRAALSLLGALYVGCLFTYLVALRELPRSSPRSRTATASRSSPRRSPHLGQRHRRLLRRPRWGVRKLLPRVSPGRQSRARWEARMHGPAAALLFRWAPARSRSWDCWLVPAPGSWPAGWPRPATWPNRC